MGKLLLFLAMAGTFGGAGAAGFCERMPMDPEVPAGLAGSYEVLGKDPVTGASYAGTLVLEGGKDGYVLTRTVEGQALDGEAWIERCTADRIMALLVRYHAQPAIEMFCALGGDGDNYYRITCRSRQGEDPPSGLEAWFQGR